MRTKSGSITDRLLTALKIHHTRVLTAYSPEEYLLKYVIAARKNFTTGKDQEKQIDKLRRLFMRAGLNGCEYNPDTMLSYIFNPVTPPGDEGYLAGWLIEQGYITREDIQEVLNV